MVLYLFSEPFAKSLLRSFPFAHDGSEKRHKKIAIQLLRKTTVWRKSDLSGKIHTLIGFRNFILTLVFRGCQEYFILQWSINNSLNNSLGHIKTWIVVLPKTIHIACKIS